MSEKTLIREQEMREAVRAAEKRVEYEWQYGPDALTRDSPEAQAYRASKGRLKHPLEVAKAHSRAAAREVLRERWAREDREDTEQQVELPPHITREGK